MQDIQIIGKQTLFLLRMLGYFLLLLFFLDISFVSIPLKFTDAAWELNTYGQIIERIPLLLLSFPLIFFGEYNNRWNWEILATKIVSWFTILMAIFLFLGIPLIILNSFRVQNLQHAELFKNSTIQRASSEKLADRLNKASEDSEIRNVLKELASGQQEAIAKIPDLQEAKKNLLTKINDAIVENQSQVEVKKRQISVFLLKNCAKWAIVGLLSAILLIYFWMQSKWARCGIRDTSQVLKISPNTVIKQLKKRGRHRSR